MTQFKDALDEFESPTNYEMIGHRDTIRLALRIADKIIQEPSEGMKGAGSESSYKLDEVRPSVANKIFRAMIEQMMRELSD